MLKKDIIIVGAGIAGLSTAYFLSNNFKVTIIFNNSQKIHSSTQLAQGGIAASKNWILHYNDTLKAGEYMNNKAIVKMFCKEAFNAVQFLKNEIKVPFRQKKALEGAHSENRVWTTGDDTGKKIHKHLLAKCKKIKNIEWINGDVVSLLKLENNKKKHSVCGIQYKKNNNIIEILSQYVILCTGGIGGLFKYSTNPEILHGDGLILANDCGAKLENLNFIQFHPTGLKNNNKPIFLLSESLRGCGAQLRNEKNIRFLNQLKLKELSARNIIVKEMFKQKEVFLDLRHKEKSFWKKNYPNIYKKLLKEKYDVSKNLIPVTATEHFLCGGIKTDSFGETSIKKLYAIGECASTGLHGTNRLASNSLSEAIVFARRCADKIIKARIKKQWNKNFEYSPFTIIKKRANHNTIEKIRSIMQENLNPIIQNKIKLKNKLEDIEDCIEKRTALLFT